MQGHVFEVTPTIDTLAYTAEDQVGGIQTITGCNAQGFDLGLLRSVTVVDESKQSAALNIFFFDELPTVASVNNGPIDIVDAQMTAKCIGHVAIAATDYKPVSGSSTACVRVEMPVKPAKVNSTIYAVVSTTGTPTYGAADDLTFKYAFQW